MPRVALAWQVTQGQNPAVDSLHAWRLSSVVEHLLDTQRVAGSSPAGATSFGALAQLGERLICIQKVIGSIPIGSTNKY